MKWLIYHLYLKPLIIEDKRERFFGRKPDEWFWADEIAVEWGYFCDYQTTLSDYGLLSDERLAEMNEIMAKFERGEESRL